ncbi:TonB-dependent receptor domain-containing protein [Neogemmobacter tilapiae]|uniref:TonB-dependent receptor n=1 Tax=Neogemmobacter tilapiae TaxID=875041 RepID=A0A918TUP0_9RHOB|nr:TonB-dependent receptor [Gemmobacter tilapiae]GHC63384.1 TonB-dependent receptor [Gemmobacter tilapiae]
MSRNATCLICLAAFWPATLVAQEAGEVTDLDAITVTAPDQTAGSGVAGLGLDQPGETALSGAALSRQQGQGLAGMLGSVAGVTIDQPAEEAGMAVNIRGMQDVGRVAVTIDGVRQNFARSGHGANGQFFADPEMLRSVTVTRGPQGGAGAVAGGVALTTVGADDLIDDGETQGGEVRLRYGDLTDTPTLHLAWAKRFDNGLDLTFAGTRTDEGDYRAGNGDDIFAAQTKNSLLAKVGYELASDQRLQLGFSHLQEDYTTGKAAGTPRANTAINDTITLDYSLNPSDRIDLKATVYLTETELDQRALLAGLTTRSYATRTTGLKLGNIMLFDGLGAEHSLTLGLEAFRDKVATEDPDNTAGTLTPSGERTVWSLSAEDRMDFGRLALTFAAKAEGYDLSSVDGGSDGHGFTPRLGVDFELNEGLTLFASAAKTFRPPALSEALVNGSHPPPADFDIRPNPNLLPERGENLELGLSLSAQDAFAAGDSLTGRLTAFRNDLRDYIGLEWQGGFFDGYYQYANISAVRIEGVELEAAYDSGRFFGSLSAQSMRGIDRTTGAELESVSPDKLVLTAGLRSADERTEYGLRGTMTGAKENMALGGERWQTLDLFINHEVGENGLFSLTVNNLTDQAYIPHLSTEPAPGINAQASFTLRF